MCFATFNSKPSAAYNSAGCATRTPYKVASAGARTGRRQHCVETHLDERGLADAGVAGDEERLVAADQQVGHEAVAVDLKHNHTTT